MASHTEITEQGTSKTIRAGEIDIHYHDVGSGDPLVLLHSYGPGTTGWKRCGLSRAAARTSEPGSGYC